MRISPTWLREFVDIKVNDRKLADDLTLAGVAVESVREMDGQTVFEMEIGTNRPDAMCHYGVARECSAIYDIALKPVAPKLAKAKPAAAPFPIEIQDAKGCARYTARVIRNVKIAPSPVKTLERLRIDDHGGVSNAVDASNYTLMEIGHPTHAFDLDKLEGGKIIVRRARAGESLKTLDGIERKLGPEDLIIADAVRPVALAGIMGGLDSAISASTKSILIESAWFDPAAVRKTARRLGCHTDASPTFHRWPDMGAPPRDWGPSWVSDPPTWRLDIEREIDLIEEIARIYGYNKFPNTLPAFSGGVIELPHAEAENKLRSEMLALGYNEALSPTFISAADAGAFSKTAPVMLANPLSEEQSVMRTSLVPGMLGMLGWNLNRGATDVRLFESGHVFSLAGERSEERKTICIGATGNANQPNVHEKGRAYSFFDLKGDVGSLLSAFDLPGLRTDDQTPDYYHP